MERCKTNVTAVAVDRKNSGREVSRYWRLEKCGSGIKITLVTCSIVEIQCFVGAPLSTYSEVNRC